MAFGALWSGAGGCSLCLYADLAWRNGFGYSLCYFLPCSFCIGSFCEYGHIGVFEEKRSKYIG